MVVVVGSGRTEEPDEVRGFPSGSDASAGQGEAERRPEDHLLPLLGLASGSPRLSFRGGLTPFGPLHWVVFPCRGVADDLALALLRAFSRRSNEPATVGTAQNARLLVSE